MMIIKFKGAEYEEGSFTRKNHVGYFELYDENNNFIYYESSTGYWAKYEYDDNNNEIYHEDFDGYWEKYQYDENNKLIKTESGKIIDYDELFFENHDTCYTLEDYMQTLIEEDRDLGVCDQAYVRRNFQIDNIDIDSMLESAAGDYHETVYESITKNHLEDIAKLVNDYLAKQEIYCFVFKELYTFTDEEQKQFKEMQKKHYN